MAHALSDLGAPSHREFTPAAFDRLGVKKYASCLLTGLLLATAVAALGLGFSLIAFILGFYAIEARLAFAFPAKIVYGPRARRAHRALFNRAGGQLNTMATVMVLAGVMVFGGVFGRGFTRCWLLGCLAILIWFRALRERDGARPPMLEWGARGVMVVRRERLRVEGGAAAPRILFASDLHVGAWASDRSARSLIRVARREGPDLILLGGDLVDGRRGLPALEPVLSTLLEIAPVVALPGNHDALAGIAHVREIVRQSGGFWLPDGAYLGDKVEVRALGQAATRRDLTQILLVHDPASVATMGSDMPDLVLSGHLHGCQVILGRFAGRDWPGAFLYRWNGPSFDLGTSRLLVSRGCSDTIPLRFRCPRDVIVIEPEVDESSRQRLVPAPN